ncbi:MAG: tyrosine-type recombinase/integrase [Sulfurihydrogenibium sp.]
MQEIYGYILKLKKIGLSESSIETYKIQLKHFEEWFKEKELPNLNLSEKDVLDFVSYLKSKELSPNTIRQILNRVKDFVEHAGGQWNASKRVYRERSKVESAKPFSEIELKKIFNWLRENNKIYYYLTLTLYGFGLRVSEALNLLPSDIIEKESQIFVRVRPENAKFSKSREAPLILKDKYRDNLLDFILSRQNPALKDKTLFTYYNDVQNRIVVLNRMAVKVYFHKLSKILDINITAHRFRDSYVSYLIAKGLKPSTVAKWLGHTDINTTLRYYTKLTEKDELEELKKL